ncbi:trafficking protein particle complex II-specific subunit 120 [Trichomonascus vanleenenianus]|uniref:TRAPPII-specific subunit TRS120 n=1 Tax=Trichomonascus vanleenenianus TaxID=2268995 RepID=UPI003EC9EE66
MLDPYSYVAPSRVRSFLCPVGRIKRHAFYQYADRLLRAREVRLVDVTPDPRSDRAMFSPQGFPNGKVVYDFGLSPIDEQLSSLYDMEPFRQTLLVVGVASYKDMDEGADYEKDLRQLRKLYPSAICHKIVVFGVSDSEESLRGLSKHVFAIPSSKTKTHFTSLETTMCDITSDFLAELAVFAISKQLGALKSPGLKQLDTPEAASRPGDKPYNVSLRHGLVRHTPSASSVNLSRSGSVTKNGSISIGPTERQKSKQRGRSIKFSGNLYLLAGRVPDALKQFTEAATLLKGSYDHLWFASTLECIGVCLVLQSFLEVPLSIPQIALSVSLHGGAGGGAGSPHHHQFGHRSTHSFFDSTPTLQSQLGGGGSQSASGTGTHSKNSSVSSVLSDVLPASHTTQTFSMSSPPSVYDFLPELTSSVLRFYARSQGSVEESVPQLVYCESILRFTKLLVLTRLGGGWNSAVLSAIVRGSPVNKNIKRDSTPATVIAHWCNRIYTTELSNLPVLAQCNIYSGIASVYSSIGLYRKRTFVLRELLINIIPKIVKSRKQKQQDLRSPYNSGGFMSLLDGVQEKGILDLLDDLCKVYGAGDITACGYGWIELKVAFLKTCISVCESIPDFEGVIHYAGLLLSTSADSLSKEEQVRYFRTIHRILDTSRQVGRGDIAATYWDPYIVRDIKIASHGFNLPVEALASKDIDKQEVFLYNPYAAKPEIQQQMVLVENEKVEFTVKLQNPFEFEVRISELSLLTKGVVLSNSLTNIYISPSSIHEVTVSAVPKGTGKLIIEGCRIQVAGCSPDDFYLLEKEEWHLDEKIKGVGVYSGERAKDVEIRTTEKRQLEYLVITDQPILAVKSMSLNQGWVMLLEGERHEFSLVVSNISRVPVNLMHFAFFDSTTEPLQQAMQNKELPLSEVFECEYFLYTRRALEWTNSRKFSIEPHHTGDMKIQIAGKRGMTFATLTLDYSNTRDDEAKAEGSIWTRKLTVPIHVTVNSSIELGGCDVIPLQSCKAFMTSSCGSQALSDFMTSLSSGEQLSNYVILLADLRNAWTQPMNVSIWSKKGDGKLVEMEETIQPNKTKRFLLPVKWDPLTEQEADSQIQLMTRKQYVVDQLMTVEQARFMRESFWNREKLLGLIGGAWQVQDSGRKGSIEMRGLRLTPRMVNVLRMRRVEMTMALEKYEEGEESTIIKLNETTYQVDTDDISTKITVSVHNRGSHKISGMLRIIPTMRYQENAEEDDINNKILYNGLLQQPMYDIQPDESVDLELGVVFVSRGEYEWVSIFEVFDPPGLQQIGQKQPLYVKAI